MNKKSSRLYILYKKGKLRKSLYYLQSRGYKLLGCGTQVYAYWNDRSKYVLKLCPNSINIMKNNQISMLQNVVNIDNYFVRINIFQNCSHHLLYGSFAHWSINHSYLKCG